MWIILFSVLASCVSANEDSRLVGGSDADIAHFPYMWRIRRRHCSLSVVGGSDADIAHFPWWEDQTQTLLTFRGGRIRRRHCSLSVHVEDQTQTLLTFRGGRIRRRHCSLSVVGGSDADIAHFPWWEDQTQTLLTFRGGRIRRRHCSLSVVGGSDADIAHFPWWEDQTQTLLTFRGGRIRRRHCSLSVVGGSDADIAHFPWWEDQTQTLLTFRGGRIRRRHCSLSVVGGSDADIAHFPWWEDQTQTLLTFRGGRIRRRHCSLSVVGGSDADIAHFPYMCSLLYSGTHTCGCVIISATKILTTAQCVDGRTPSLLSALAGQTDRTSGVPIPLENIKMHEDFNTGIYRSYNDIAIGNLARPLDLSNPLIQTATLDTSSDDFTNTSCIFTGWGSSNSTTTFPNILQRANLTVISNNDCQRNFTTIYIGEGQLCVHDENKSICLADLGSPVVCKGVVVGLASFGVLINGECSSVYPAVFTRITYFQDWIMNVPLKL